MKKIKDIGFKVDELSETQGDLTEAIDKKAEELGLSGCAELIRIKRILNNKFQYCRSVVRAQNYLERNGHCEVIK